MCVHHTVQKFHLKRDKIYVLNENFDPDKRKMTELIDFDSVYTVKIATVAKKSNYIFFLLPLFMLLS